MFNLKKFTALAMAGTFAFGVAATTTYAAAAPQRELPKAEQPAPQQNKQQDKQAKQQDKVIRVEQMKDFEGQKDKKAQPDKQPAAKAPATQQKSKEVKETKHDQNHQQAPQEKKLPAQPEHK